jgi:hypothetical protein
MVGHASNARNARLRHSREFRLRIAKLARPRPTGRKDSLRLRVDRYVGVRLADLLAQNIDVYRDLGGDPADDEPGVRPLYRKSLWQPSAFERVAR